MLTSRPFYLITHLVILFSLATCTVNPGKTKSEKIDYILQKAADNKEFIGNVLVADQGTVIYQRSFGNASQENNTPNTDTTKFLIASVSKPITAILILKLADKGLLKLTDSLHQYFPNTPSNIGQVTIHHLLTHTSGLHEFIDKKKGMDAATLVEKATLNTEPGANFEYCNSGYVLLKEIAEATTKRDFTELLQTEIFHVAGMTSSGVMRSALLPSIAIGYKDAAQVSRVDLDFPVENIDGAGSVYSTAEDLYKLDQALYTEALLSNEMKEKMLTQHVSEKYSYGWFVRERGGEWNVYWHPGDLPGVSSFISRNIQRKQFIALLSNTEHLDLSDIENQIARILKEKD